MKRDKDSRTSRWLALLAATLIWTSADGQRQWPAPPVSRPAIEHSTEPGPIARPASAVPGFFCLR